jgi:hypothetical protein
MSKCADHMLLFDTTIVDPGKQRDMQWPQSDP